MKKVFNWIVNILLLLLIVLVLTSVYGRYQYSQNSDKIPMTLGFATLEVLSGSMEPMLEVGDYILIRETDTDQLSEGDVITFYNENGIVITHRIIAVQEDGGQRSFKTMGDNNNVEDDGYIPADQVIGKYMMTLVVFGFISRLTSNVFYVWGLVVVVILIMLALEFRKDTRKKRTA